VNNKESDMRYGMMAAIKAQLVVCVCMVGIAFSAAEAQRLPCRAVDAFDVNDQQPAEEMLRVKKGDVFSWRLDGIKAGTVDVELTYVCTGAGGSSVSVELGDKKLEARSKNTGMDK